MYAAGVSQRKAAEILSLLLGHRFSHETLSALTDRSPGRQQEAFRAAALPEEMAFVYLDGLSKGLQGRRKGSCGKVYVALGIAPDGGDGSWGSGCPRRAPGMGGVLGSFGSGACGGCCSSSPTGCPGFLKLIRRVYPQAEWQRWVVHRGAVGCLSQVRCGGTGPCWRSET